MTREGAYVEAVERICALSGSIDSTVVRTDTFRHSTKPTVLIVEPTWDDLPTGDNPDGYHRDARQLKQWLQKVFCGDTLAALKEIL